MKKILLIIAIVASGSVYSNTIPGPFWYNISEKILAEAHQLIGPDAIEMKNTTTKTKAVKTAKTAKNALKCQPKKEIELPSPYLTITGNGMWIFNE